VSVVVPAHAASYDPDLSWQTLTTEHFQITFHTGEEQLASELAETAERVHEVLTEDLDHEPNRRTEVVLVDHTDGANGYAMTVPYNQIVIFVTAPNETGTLGFYEDWLEAIFTHEYAHILHLDTVEGIPAVLRAVLGRIIGPNNLSPWWIVEGQATYHETRFTTGGRGRSPYVDMILRSAALEDGFPALGNLDGLMSDPPGGNARYLFGQSFLQYIADHSSEDAWTRWNHTYGSWVPYHLPARRVFGKSFRAFYKEWRASLEAHYAEVRERVLSEGLTVPVLLSEPNDTCTAPFFSPDGQKMVFACSDRREGSDVYVANADGGEIEVEIEGVGAKAFSWRPDSEAFAYSFTSTVDLYSSWYDVYVRELGGRTTRLTSGKRARDAAFSPDGNEVWVVRNRVQDNNLARVKVGGQLEKLTDFDDHTQLSTPTFSPDGRFIAVSMWQDGMRDLWLLHRDGSPYRRITMDTALDRDPAWSADGRFLFFSSDRSGIPNLYAVDLESERLWQVTNVLGGAFQPSVRPDFEMLGYQHFTHAGFQAALLPIEPESWADRGVLALPLEHRGPLAPVVAGRGPAPGEPEPWAWTAADALEEEEPDAAVSVPSAWDPSNPMAWTVTPDEEEEEPYDFDHPVANYNPFRTIVPPRYVAPALYSTTFGYMGLLYTSGVDTLRQLGWSAYGSYRTDARYVGGGGAVTLNRWKPILSAGVRTYVAAYGDIYVYSTPTEGSNVPSIESANERYWDRRIRPFASVSYPLSSRQAVFARYSGMFRSPLNGLPDNPYQPWLPTRGFLSTVGGGWRYARGKSYSYSISPEDARVLAITGEITSRYLGSYVLDDTGAPAPFDQVQLSAEAREYIAVPWFANHVFAVRGAGGVSFGDSIRYGNYRLGGSYGDSPFYYLPDEYRPLRGFPFSAKSGDNYYMGSAEYRFPILRLERGFGTLPLFLRTVHGAVFADGGNAFNLDEDPGSPLVGVGGELRSSFVIGWAMGLSVRVGYAVGVVGDGGYGPTDPGSVYLQLGSSF